MPDIAGNSLGTATALNLSSNVQIFPDIVTPTANDYYRFTLSHRSSFNLSLTGLSTDADVALLTSTGSVISVNGVLQSSNNTGDLAESINTTLDVGTYYIRVATGASVTSANYSLNVSAKSDLRSDILWRNYATGEDVIWQVAGGAVEAYVSLKNITDLNWALQGSGDFNQDGQSDLVWRNTSTGQNVIWLMNGTTSISDIYIKPVGDPSWQIKGVSDFNGDGQSDLVWRNTSTGQNVVWLMNGTTFSTDVYLRSVGDPSWQINGIGDFNSDGKTDILWRNYSTGQNVVWLMNGTTYSTDVYLRPVGDPSWRISGTGDFDSDGKTDILWRNYSTGQNVIWLMNGTTYSTDSYLQPVGDPNWRSLSPFVRTVEPTPISVAGNALSNAFNVGDGLTGSGTYRDSVSSLDSDYYRLNLSTPSAVSLTLTGFTNNLDVQLINSSNQLLQSSTLSNLSPEAINSTLNAGVYYVRVYTANGGSSAYALNLLINNLPVLVTNAGLTLDEGAVATIGSSLLQVTDNDSPIAQLTYTVGSLPGHGALSLNGAAIGVGSTFTQADVTSNRLRYQHDGGETLSDSFSFAVSDGTGGAIAGNTFSITVNPVNDAPVLTVPASQTVDQNANSLITGVSLADPDVGTGSETITISAANGLLSLGLTTGLTFAQGNGSAATSITASGTLSAINNALTSLIYRSNASFQGNETISITVNDNGNIGKGGSLTDSKTIAVIVNPVNKPPAITVPTSQSVNEDTSLSLTGISISDLDAGGGNVTVSLSAVNGVLSLGTTAGLTLITGTGSKDRNLTITGTLALINTALSSLSYQGNKDFNGSDLVSISVNDNGNTGNGIALSDTKSLLVTVTPVNDAPVLTVPAAQVVNENTLLQVTGISITDVDAGSGAIAVSLSATNGKLSLGTTAGLSFTSGNGSLSSSLIFSGTLAAINSALSTLVYQGNANFNGADAISINVNDNGNVGFGIPLSDSKTIAINVLGINQVPVITVPLAPSTVANTNLAIAGVSISDPDAAGGTETVTIAAANGVLSLPSNTGLTFTQGTGNQNNRITFRGTLAAINTAIGSLIYRSYPGFTGFDTISISVNDEGNTGIGTALSDTKTLFVNVGGALNSAPTANPDSYTTTRNTALTVAGQGVLANDTDPENNPLTANLLTTPTNGTVIFNGNGAFTYTPNTNYVGSDRFTYQASDGIGNSNPATVSLSVTAPVPVNQAPVALGEAFTLSQNTTFSSGNVLSNDSDPDNNVPLTAQLVTNATQGSVSLNSNGSFTYIPTTNFAGNDSFTYVAKDALGATSGTATVSLSVTAPVPVNQAPVALGEAFTLSQNTTFSSGNVLSNDSDPDNNVPLTAQLVTNATQGSVSLNSNGSFTYIPTTNFAGNDSFTYVAKDALGATSGTATVSLSVTAPVPVNQAPVALGEAFTLSQNTTFSSGNVLSNDSDPDNNVPLTAQLVTNATQGSVSLNSNGSFTYIPTTNFAGNDSFTYVAKDALGATSGTATVSLSVTAPVPVNQAPVALGEAFTLSQNTTFSSGNVLSNDSDPDNNVPLTAQLVTNATQGSVSLNSNGSFTYIPTTNFAGNDSFTYVAKDALGATSGTATVSLSVTAPVPVNQAPVALGEAFTLSQNTTFSSGNVLSNDSDPDNNVPLTAQLVTNATQGSVSLNSNGSFTYIPTTNFAGNDSFTYVAKDALGATSGTATVSLSVTAPVPVNQAPVALGEAFTLSQNTTFSSGNVLSNDSDPDNNVPLTAQLVTNATQGSVSLNSNGSFTYIPTTNFAGNDSFTYVAKDALGATSGTATVSLSVTAPVPVNQAPVALGEAFTLSQNTTFSSGNVLSNDSDPDNNVPLTAQLVTNATQGSVSLNSNGSFTYIPTANFAGNDSFTYVAKDALGATSGTATVSLSVTAPVPVNQAPVALGEAFTLSQNTTFSSGNVLSNDSDPDNNVPLTAQLVTNATQGSVSLNSNGSFTYIPTANFAGNDSFTYVAKDALGATSGTATVSLSVTAPVPVNQAPVALGEAFTLSQNTTFSSGNVLSNDSDPDNNVPLTAQLVTNATQGSVSLNSNGSFTYIPTANFAGNDSFTYVAKDALGATSGTATVSLSVTAPVPVNQAPVAVGETFRAVTSTPLTVSAASGVLRNDTDADSPTLTALSVTGPSNGSLALNSNGSFVYTPTTNFNGTDTFVYKANDGNTDSNLATVTLTVSGNTAPTANADTYAVAAGVPLTIDQLSGVLRNDSDAEGDALTASLVTNSSGSLTFNSNGTFTYTPNAGVTIGTDTFVYQVNDGFVNSAPATVTLSIGANAAPIAQSDTYTASAGSTLTVNELSGVLSNDTDVQSLTASVVSNPTNGSLALNGNGSFTYIPNASFTNGTDTFVYQASDGALTASATVTLTVTSAVAPIAQNDSYQVVAGTTLSVGQTSSVLNNDSNTNGATLTAQLVTPATQGTVVLSGDGTFTYTPNVGVTSTTDTFVYRVNNGVLNSSPATVTLTIASNARPVVSNDSYAVITNTPLTINPKGVLVNDTDSDVGQTLKAQLVSQPSHGSLLLRADGSFVYSPDAGYLGVDTFTYSANDGVQDSTSLGTVSLSIAANAAPIANPDTYSVNKNNTLIINAANGVLKNDTDIEPLTASVVANPTQGSLTLNSDGAFTYTPNAGVTNTTDTFVYRASDGSLSANATVTVTIKDTSSPPTAVNDTGYTVNANGTLTVAAVAGVLQNDTDPEGDVLKAVSNSAPSHGTVVLNNDGSFVYTPTVGYLGSDSFTYFANDGIANSLSPATVSLTIGGANQSPVITVPGSQVVFRNTDLVIQSGLSIGDPDAGTNAVAVTLAANSGNLTLSTTNNLVVSGNGSQTVTITGSIVAINAALTNLTYRPLNAGFTGADQIAIAVNDNGNTGTGGAQAANATININVTNGPALVKDINPTQNATATGTSSATPNNLTAAGGTLFFSANDGVSGVELWRSDGTDTGTSLVADLNTTPDTSGSSNPSNLTVIGNTLYFTANNSVRGTELWKADLTGATAPSIIKDIRSGASSSNPRNLVNFNGTLYFEADDGSGLVLWKTDGTTGNTVKVETTVGYSQPGLLVAAGNTLYFTAGNGNQLWRINSAGTQTTLLQDIGSGAGITNLVAIGNTLFFTAGDSSNGVELWRSDGTTAGTTRISDINEGIGDANPSSLVTLNGQLYFFAKIFAKNGSNVYQLWQSTASGALSPASAALPSTGLAPTSLTVVGSKLFFVVDAGTSTVSDLQLWQSNGSGASLVKSINPTGNDAVASLTNVNGSLFFTASDGSTRIWKSDGTDAGTVSVSANFTGVTPHNLTAVGSRLFFTAETTTSVLVIPDPQQPTVFTQINGTTGEELFVL